MHLDVILILFRALANWLYPITTNTNFKFMRKISALVLLLLWSVGLSAQTETEFAQKTRYIYLWDVTYSTVDWGNREMCDNISSFLIKDISNKQGTDAEIIIVPFNDNVVEERIIERSANEFNSTYASERDNLKEFGYNWAKEHTVDGHTNVAGALKFARERYADDASYNNIILLLTDGYNEYTEDERIVSSKDDGAKNYLRKEIKALDEAITENIDNGKCLNAFLYVIFKDRKKDGSLQWDDPRSSDDKYMNTRFITPDGGSINLHFVELTAEIKTAKGGDGYHMNLRESKFTVELKGTGFDILKKSGKKLKVNISSLDKERLLLDQTCEIDYSDKTIEAVNVKINENTVLSDCEIPVSINIVNSSDFENDTKNYVKVWLKTKTLNLKVTKKFKPQITIRVKE